MSDCSSVVGDLCSLQESRFPQPVLFHVIDRADIELLRAAEGEWLRCLCKLDWMEYRDVGAQYYQALWEFNLDAAKERASRAQRDGNSEGLVEALKRLSGERPTGGNEAASLVVPEQPRVETQPLVVRAELLRPGVVPIRLGGKTPKCFFAMFHAFVGVHLMGKGASATEVHHHLSISPPFVRACGFTIPDPDHGYRHTDVPSLRKLEQFDQIMSDRGLWTQARIQTIRRNLAGGVIQLEDKQIVQDTTHYVAHSSMTLIELTDEDRPLSDEPEDPSASPPGPNDREASRSEAGKRKCRRRTKAVRAKERESRRQENRRKARDRWRERRAKKRGPMGRKGGPTRRMMSPTNAGASSTRDNPPAKKPARKTQSRTIKRCRCQFRGDCPHPWELSDAGAGSIIKGTGVNKKKVWGHKAAVLSTTSGVPLDARAATDAASHDGVLLKPHLDAFFETYPELVGTFDEVLADAAMDDAGMKQAIEQAHGLNTRTQTNPRRIKTIEENLPRGMKGLTPAGTLTCQADRQMDFRGARYSNETFIYGPPVGLDGEPLCQTCPFKSKCCRVGASSGRHVAIPFTWLDHIDPSDPPMARRFKAAIRKRPAVERAIKRIKLDFGSDRLTRRGHAAFQAHLDRSMIAFHLMLRME